MMAKRDLLANTGTCCASLYLYTLSTLCPLPETLSRLCPENIIWPLLQESADVTTSLWCLHQCFVSLCRLLSHPMTRDSCLRISSMHQASVNHAVWVGAWWLVGWVICQGIYPGHDPYFLMMFMSFTCLNAFTLGKGKVDLGIIFPSLYLW